MARGCRVWQVDAFTAEPFAGNPAAVCLLNEPAGADWMQSVAAEMNLSETAFVQPLEAIVQPLETVASAGPSASPEGYRCRLRWFTPAAEVKLCGHATLATAHVLWQELGVPADRPLRFETLSGELGATRRGEVIQLDFPARPPRQVEPPAGLLEALGVDGAAVDSVGRDAEDYLVVLTDEAAVRALRPDQAALGLVAARGIIVTAPGEDPGISFVSRFFGPAVGVPEDPVTGSAHCCLAPYWSARLGTSEHRAYQASPRGGFVEVRLEGDRVLLGGRAVTVLRGELTV